MSLVEVTITAGWWQWALQTPDTNELVGQEKAILVKHFNDATHRNFNKYVAGESKKMLV